MRLLSHFSRPVRLLLALSMLLNLLIMPTTRVYAAGPDGLDPDFGSGGLITGASPDPTNSPFATYTAGVWDHFDNFYVAISLRNSTYSQGSGYVARYTQAGALDATFGVNGYAEINFGPNWHQLIDITLDNLGRPLVTGFYQTVPSPTNTQQLIVARLTTAGILDTTFSGDGKQMFEIEAGERTSNGNSLVVDDSGRITVAGYHGTVKHAALVLRLLDSGELDPNFGEAGTGIVSLDLGDWGATEGQDQFSAVSLTTDGKILAAGFSSSQANGRDEGVVVRLCNDGTLDDGSNCGAGFGPALSGIATLPNELGLHLSGMALDSSSRILVSGTLTPNDFSFSSAIYLARLSEIGALDATFGAGGFATAAPQGPVACTELSPCTDEGRSLAWLDTGKIMLVGTSQTAAGQSQPLAVRFCEDGSLDEGVNCGAGFGAYGIELLAASDQYIGFSQVIAKPGGMALAFGRVANGSATDGLLARFTAGPSDTTPPEAPVILTPTEDAILIVARPTISGTAEPLAQVQIYLDGSLHDTVAADASGSWSYVFASDLNDGDYTLAASAEDAAQNTSPVSVAVHFTIDAVGPDAPTITSPVNFSIFGSGSLTLNGTAEPLATVTVYVDSSEQATTTANASGVWSYTFSPALADGSYSLTATATDSQARLSPSSAAVNVTIDTLPPTAPVISAPVDGSFASDSTPSVSGSADANNTISVYADAALLGTATADGSGAWSFTPVVSWDEGVHLLTASATNALGNVSALSGEVSVTVDTIVPTVPSIASPISGSTLGDNTPTFSGTAEANAHIYLWNGIAELDAGLADSAGNWSYTPAGSLADDDYTLAAAAEDRALNRSAWSDDTLFSVDTLAPDAPTFTNPAPDAYLNDAQPVLFGGAEAFATLSLVVDGGSPISIDADKSGDWNWSPETPLSEGVHTLSLSAVDEAGNVGQAASVQFTIDLTPPSVPLISRPSADGYLNLEHPEIEGSGEAEARLFVTIDGGAPVEVTANSSGAWTYTPAPALSDGPHTVSVSQQDRAGNTGSSSAAVSFTVDATQPTMLSVTAPTMGSSVGSTPTIAGLTDPNITIHLGLDGSDWASVTSNDLGEWSYTPSSALADGSHMLAIVAEDAAGNQRSAFLPLMFTVDTLAPAAPVVAAPVNNAALNHNNPVFSGATEAGTTIALVLDGGAPISVIPAADGAWTYDGGLTLAEGSHTLTATASDGAGNSSAAVTVAFSVDTLAPAAPTLLTPQKDDLLNDRTPTFKGTSEPAAKIELWLGGVPHATVVADANGAWEYTPTLELGNNSTHYWTARATDAAGNVSVKPPEIKFVIDAVAPTVSAFTRSDARVTALPQVRYQIVFREPVIGLQLSHFDLVLLPLTDASGRTHTLEGATLVSLSGSGGIYDITVATGKGSGNLGLTLARTNGLHDAAGTEVSGLPTSTILYEINRGLSLNLGVSGLAEFDHPLTLTADLAAKRLYGGYTKPIDSDFTGTGIGLPAPTGSIVFYEGDTLLGTSPLVGTWITDSEHLNASLTIDPPQAGEHTYRAVYAGDALFEPVETTLNQTIAPTDITLNLQTLAGALRYGDPVLFEASLIPGSQAASGTISIAIDGGAPQTAAVTGNQAWLNLTGVGAGDHTASASYSGDSRYRPATATVTFHVDPAELTVSAQPAARRVGAANPTFTPKYSGWIYDDSPAVLSGTPSFTTSATAVSPAGFYPITVGAGTLTAANYSLRFFPGQLLVHTPPQAGALPDQTFTAGQGLTFALPEGSFTDLDLIDYLTLSAGLSGGKALPSWLVFQPAQAAFHAAAAVAGSYRIEVTATDLWGDTASGSFTLTVAAPAADNHAPTAQADRLTVVAGQSAHLNLLTNDSDRDGDALRLLRVSAFSLNQANGATTDPLTVTNPSAYNAGAASLQGQVDFDPSGALTVTLPRYAPAGTASLVYEVGDGRGGLASAMVNVTVQAAAFGPQGLDDIAVTEMDTPVYMPILGNDLPGSTGGAPTFTRIVTNPQHGQASWISGSPHAALIASNVLRYEPAKGFRGADSLTYEIGSGSQSAVVTVTIVVDPQEDQVYALEDFFVTGQERAVALDVLANDQLISGEATGLAVVRAPQHGQLIAAGPRGWTYLPQAGFSGDDSFAYGLSNGQTGYGSAEVKIKVLPTVKAPTALPDRANVARGRSVILLPLANDSSHPAGKLTLVGASASEHGVVTLLGDGTLRYTPAKDFIGTDWIQYVVMDSQGITNLGLIQVTVKGAYFLYLPTSTLTR